jgi:hypothetical protein
MLKKFHGAHLMEALHRKKLRDLLSKELLASRLVKIFIASLAMITLWAIPTAAFGVEGLTLVQQRVIAIFVFAILMWIFNAIPAWTTSTFVVVLLLFCTSDSSLWFFREGIPAEELMYVGDHPINDIDGSRNAGYTPVWVKTTGYWCFEEIPRAEYEVETVAEIPDLVAQINGK